MQGLEYHPPDNWKHMCNFTFGSLRAWFGIHPSTDSPYLVKKKSMYRWTHAVQTHVKGQRPYKMVTTVSWINIHHLT